MFNSFDDYLDNFDNEYEGERHGGEHQEDWAQGEEVGHDAGALLTRDVELAELATTHFVIKSTLCYSVCLLKLPSRSSICNN